MPRDYAAWASRWRVPLGFGLAVFYLLLARPTPKLLLSGAALSLAGLALRAWAAGYLDKNRRLATGGPYAYTRNPLYLGSALMGLGGALAGRSWLVGGAFAVLFALVYWPVMRRESRFLEKEFPETFESYARRAPLFFPRPSPWRSERGSERFEWRLYVRNREYRAAAGYAGVMVFLALKMWLS
ncbi:MAG TPA: isoprenylcysteine carboxylmethyltransferase family protein [Terriglobia bacterium]|nr:isoprenylcysteine carboxylmethyltransferase family protein [Terriglobia bacterium]